MKTSKRILAILMALSLVMALGVTAFADTVQVGTGNNTITVDKAKKGETYKLYKLFDATVSNGEVVKFTGTVPSTLNAYFELKDGEIVTKAAAWTDDTETEMSTNLRAALKTWASSATAVAQKTLSGSELLFTDVAPGYYVLTTTQGDQLITVNTVKANITLVDKNTPTEVDPTKTVGDKEVSIGDFATYTVEKITNNYIDGDPVIKYSISDTLPAFLDAPTVTEFTIGGEEYRVNGQIPQFVNKTIEIPWTQDGTPNSDHLYATGAVIKIVYKAKVNSNLKLGNIEDNKNEVTVVATTQEPGGDPKTYQTTTTETVKSSAAALQKVDSKDSTKKLTGAKFAVTGLVATGSKGNYTVVSYDKTAQASSADTEMECDDTGLLVIRGIASDETLVARETKAPEGYKLATNTVNLIPAVVSEEITVTTRYYNDQGVEIQDPTTATETRVSSAQLTAATVNVPNTKGVVLPDTGGIGTTIFYILGSCMLLGAAVLLITRRRMGKEG